MTKAEKEAAEKAAEALAKFGEPRELSFHQVMLDSMRRVFKSEILGDIVKHSDALNSLLTSKESRSATYSAQFSGDNHGTQKSGDVQEVLPKRSETVKPKSGQGNGFW